MRIYSTTHKIFQTLSYPDVLDLMAYQQIVTLPLRYRLGSVVTHHGDFVDPEEADRIIAQQVQDQTDKDAQEAESLALARKLWSQEFPRASKGKGDAEESDDESKQGNSDGDEADKDEDQDEEDEVDEDEDEDAEDADADEDAEVEQASEDEDASDIAPSEISEDLQQAILNSTLDTQHNEPNAESLDDASTESEEPWRGTDDADAPAPTSDVESSDKELSNMEESDLYALGVEVGDKQPEVMMGHYIAIAREPDGTFSTINDSGVQSITRPQFLANPQWSNCQEFQVYILTYTRDDTLRNMPMAMTERWIKETT